MSNAIVQIVFIVAGILFTGAFWLTMWHLMNPVTKVHPSAFKK